MGAWVRNQRRLAKLPRDAHVVGCRLELALHRLVVALLREHHGILVLCIMLFRS